LKIEMKCTWSLNSMSMWIDEKVMDVLVLKIVCFHTFKSHGLRARNSQKLVSNNMAMWW
jgi:hypothetical protein